MTRVPLAPETRGDSARPGRLGAGGRGERQPRRPRGLLAGSGILVVLLGILLVASAWHLTQGTSGLSLGDLLAALFGNGSAEARDILTGSRLPRLAAGVAVGCALGVAGVLLQSLARNALASPDTLGVTAGSYLAVTAVAALGLSLPFWASGIVAFVGGLLAAALVLGLAGGAGTSTTRLVLAGTALAMALQAATSTLLVLADEKTKGLLAWGNGTLSQLSITAFFNALPVLVVAIVGAVALSRRLDVLGLGDDTAHALGIPVRSTRAIGILVAVVLTATAVTLAGPIGFVGLCAPVIARLLGRIVPSVHLHAMLIPASGLLGAIVVVLADALLRLVLGAEAAMSVPTGVATTLLGAIVLVAMARKIRDSGPTREPPQVRLGLKSSRIFVVVVVVAAAVSGGAALLGLLAGHTWVLTGDIAQWVQGIAPPRIAFALDERAPRIVAALVAGAALALAGSMVQSVSRNPLAEPGILGITGGAGLGAVLVVTSGVATVSGTIIAAGVGGLLAFALVYALAWRGGVNADRLVLIGIGVSYAAVALTTLLLLRSDPWNTPRIFTWLSGTTYGREWEQIVPVAVVLAVAIPLVLALRRELDIVAIDEDSPRLVGIRLERTRLTVLVIAALLAAMSVGAVGVVGFVGLVAPHAARSLVGAKHSRSIPVAMLLGAALVGLADTIGRTVVAPAQIPVGLIVALVGAPYFVWLLWRSRVR